MQKHLDNMDKNGAIFVCSCCKCCCGPLELTSCLAKPSQFFRNNFHAVLDAGKCEGCGKCSGKCVMEAITAMDKKAVSISLNRCIGCGICVTRCPSGALSLMKKPEEYTPPQTFGALLDKINKDKKGFVGRWVTAGRRVIGL